MMELNDLRVIICLRKSKVTVERIFIVERISVCNVTEKLMEHTIQSAMLLYQRHHRSVTIAAMTSTGF